jgi:hypothetical protein
MRNFVNRLIVPEITDFVYSICYTLITPFHLWSISYDTEAILFFLRSNIIKHPLLGYVMKYSLFEEVETRASSIKTLQSYKIFKKKYELANI